MSETAPETETARHATSKRVRTFYPAEPDDPPLALANGPPPPVGRPMSNAEIMKLRDEDLPNWIPPAPLVGRPMSNAEIMKLRDEDLPCEAPVVDSHEQQRTFRYAGNVLHAHFAHREDVQVGVDTGVFYLPEDLRGAVPIEAGRQQARRRYVPLVVPDVLVAFGVQRRRYGGSYQTWIEGKVPDFVMEVASTGTWKNDYGRKRDLYERLGVKEYFIYDARDGHQRLTAWRANAEARYEEVRPIMHEGVGPGIRSELVGLVAFVDEAREFAWWDPDKRERCRDYEEAEAQRQEAEAQRQEAVAQRDRERRKRDEAERSVAALRAELAKLRDERDGPPPGR